VSSRNRDNDFPQEIRFILDVSRLFGGDKIASSAGRLSGPNINKCVGTLAVIGYNIVCWLRVTSYIYIIIDIRQQYYGNINISFHFVIILRLSLRRVSMSRGVFDRPSSIVVGAEKNIPTDKQKKN